MGTTFSVTIADPRNALSIEPDLQGIAERIRAILLDVNRTMSTYDPHSEISKFNATASTEPMSISLDFAKVVARAKEIHQASDGRFDITVSPLVDLWGFGRKGERTAPPTQEEIDRVREKVGSDKLEVTLDPPTIRKTEPGVEINLNAIAPGYAADRMASLLVELGYDNHLVDVGGEFVARGLNDQGDPWRIAIERPERTGLPKQSMEMTLVPGNQAVATSGDYRQYFEHEGKFFAHTIDPTTGRPAMHALASATVLASEAMSADGWATAVMAVGPERGLAMIESLPGVEAILLVRRGDGSFEHRLSSGAQAFLPALSSGSP
jgi:thiamine biosynthesis lipoprotein